MHKKVSFSNQVQELEDIVTYLTISSNAIIHYKRSIRKLVVGGKEDIPKEFLGMSLEEVNEYFIEVVHHLERDASLSLLASVEAKLRMDFLDRVYNKRKDDLSRIFRETYKKKGHHVQMEQDLLDSWVDICPQHKQVIGYYKGALQYRNWLAHGRYWSPKLGDKYEFATVYSICREFISSLGV
jgi:putative transposon-encoded protein